MARFVLFTKTLCFDADQQVFYPMHTPSQRVALSPLQTAVVRRVLNAQGKLVRNQTLLALFQREPSDLPFADRLVTTIAEINRLALLAHAPGPLVHQVPLIGCVLAEQADAVPLSDEPAVRVEAAEPAAPEPTAVNAPQVTPKKPFPLRGIIIALLLINAALALVARHEFAPVTKNALTYKPYLTEKNTQFFIAESLSPDSFVVKNAMRRYHYWQPRLPNGAVAPLVYINVGRTQVSSSTFLCPKPIAQKDNECVSWLVMTEEMPDA